MKFSVKKRANLKLRDAFRVEALEPRVLLSADPIIGMAAVMLPADSGHDFLIQDAYQGQATPDSSSATLAEQALASPSSASGDTATTATTGAHGAQLRSFGAAATNANAQNAVVFSADTSSDTDILIDNAIVIDGANITITAGSDGSGNMSLGSSTTGATIRGNSGGILDGVTLRAPGNITIGVPVGASNAANGGMSNMVIDGVDVLGNGVLDLPDSVSFSDTVTLSGNLTIHTSGVVNFAKAVNISGGSLTILGASAINFNAGVTVAGGGDIFLEADEVTFPTGGESINGTGVLTLRPATMQNAIELGSPPGGVVTNTLNIDNNEIVTFGDGFSKIVVGWQSGGHAVAGSGAVRIGAINAVEQPTLRDNLEVYGGTITVADYASPTQNYTTLVTGSIKLDAVGNIDIYNQLEANNNGTLADITLNSTTGAIRQFDASADGITGEPLRGAHLEANAAQGISLLYTELASVSAHNTGASGNIVIHETAVGGALLVNEITQSNSAATGAIDVSTSGGALTLDAVGAGITHAGTGAVSLRSSGALGLAHDITAAGGLVSLQSAGAIVMSDGHTVSSLNQLDTGAVTLVAGSGIALSHIVADGTIALTAQNGAINDILTGNGPNLDGDTASAALAATTGIGAAGAAIQTRLAGLSLANTISGGAFINEATGLRLDGAGAYAVDLAGTTANLSVATVDGALLVLKAVRSTGASGNLLLKSGEALEATGADLDVRANITSTNGSISLISSDSVLVDNQGAGAPLIATLKSDQTIEIKADNAITMEALAALQTNNNNVRLEAAGGSITLGTISTGTGSISLRAGADILDGQLDDAASPRTVNLAASALRMEAAGRIGSTGDSLEVQAGKLAFAAGSGSYIAGTGASSLATVGPIAVKRVASDGTSSALSDGAALSGASSMGDLALSGGALTIDAAMSASGNLRVSASGPLTMNAALSAGGSLSTLSDGAITQNAAAILSAAAGTIDVASSAAAILMQDGARAITNAGNIRYQAATAVTVSLLDARTSSDRAGAQLTGQAGWGAVSVVAGGAVADAAGSGSARPAIYAGALRLNAGGAIGSGTNALDTEAATLSGAGSAVFLNEASAITIAPLSALSVNRVLADGTVAGSTVTDAAQGKLAATGALVLQAAGALASVAGGAVSAGANLLLAAGGDITLGAAVGSTGSIGNISVSAGRDLLQNATIGAAGAGQSIDLAATRDILMAEASATASNGGNIGLRAGGNAVIETVDAASGDVRITAGGSILDQDAGADTEVDIVGNRLLLNAGGAIGTGANALETTVATMSASAGSGGVFIAETDGLVVDTVAVQVNRVDAVGAAAASAYAAQSNLSATGAGHVVVSAGALTISDDVSAAAGNILLKAASGSLVINNSVASSGGAVSLSAGAAITQKAQVAGASIDAMAATSIAMDDGVSSSAAGNVRYQAGTSLAIGSISSGAIVSLKAASIVDSGTSDIDVSAAALLVQGAVTTGSAGAHLQTAVGLLAGNGGSAGLFIDETDALQIGQIGAVTTARVGLDGLAGTVQDLGASALSSGTVVITAAGALHVDVAVGATGNLRLQTTGASADITINEALVNYGGNTTVSAGRDLLVNGSVANTTAARTIDLQAVRDITLGQGSAVSATSGNIALSAGRNATIETVATTGSVSIVAQGGAIIDGDANGDTEVDISAAGLLLRAAGGIGAGLNHLETSAATLSAQGGSGGVFIDEADSLTVDGVSVQVNRVDAAGVATATTNAIQNNLTATGNGAVLLRSGSGSLSISDTVSTAGGNLRLEAAGASLVINDAVSAAGGAIHITSAGTLVQKASIANSGAGTIELGAAGALSMDDGVAITGAANIRASAGTGAVMAIGTITTTGAVSLAAGSIVDSGTADIDVSAAALRIVATNATGSGSGIGSGARHLQVAVGTLAGSSSGSASGNGIYLDAIGSVVIDTVGPIAVLRIGADGSVGAVDSAAISDLASSGNLVLSAAGSITVNQGLDPAASVAAGGNLLLQATGAGADVVLNAEAWSYGGAVTVDAGRDLLLAGRIGNALAGASIDVSAARNLVMADGGMLQSRDGNVLLRSGGDATIDLIDAGAGAIAVSAGGSIIDQDGAADTDLDILGGAVQLSAGNAIGSAGSSLETSIATLSANAGAGGVYISATGALLIDSVTVQVNRVGATGTATLTGNAAQANVSASGAGNIAISATGLTISDAVGSASGAILLDARSGALTQNDAVSSTSGAVSLLAGGLLAQKAGITTGGSVDLESRGASVLMDDGVVTSAGGNVRYAAFDTLAIGAIVTSANASLTAAHVADAGGPEVDVSANALRLRSSLAGDVRLQTAVTTVAARVAGGLSLADIDGLTVGSVGAIGVSRLAQDGTVSQVADAAMSGLANAGNLLLQTSAAGDLVLDAAVNAGGNISLNSTRDIIQNGLVAATGAGNSADVLAARDIAMGADAILATDAGAISLRAVGGGATIGRIDARTHADALADAVAGQADWGAVSIAAAGAIADNLETVATIDVLASTLSVSGSALGSAANYLETEVVSLAGVIGAGGAFVQDASALAIGAHGAVGVKRVAFGGSAGVVEAAAQSGLTSGASAVVSSAGALSVGTALAVTGNLLLASGDDILVNAGITSSAGSISLNAARDILQNAAIATAAAGKTIDLLAGRDIAMGAGGVSATTNGNLLLAAGRDITIATLNAGSGSVGVQAGGSILDQDGAGDSRLNIGAAGLQLKAGNAIGAGSNHLEVAVSTLSAAAGAGGMYLAEADGVTVAALAVQAQRIDGNAVAVATANAVQADLRTTAGGNIVLSSAGGALVLGGGAVAADGGGNVLIAGGDIAVNGNLTSAGGNVTVLAAGAIAMMGNTSISGAQVRLAAGGNAAIGNVSAGSASIVSGGAISAASGSAINVNAAGLRLQAAGSARLATAVDTVAAAGAGVTISESDSIAVGTIAPVLQVNLDGSSSSADGDSALAGLASTANGNLILTAGGSIDVLDTMRVAADGSGNVLLRAQGGALGLGRNADVVSGSGHVSLIAGGGLSLGAGAGLRTAGGGDIDIEAGAAFTQLDGSVIANADGSIRLQAAGEVLLASIASGGNVAITSLTGSILEDGDAAVDVSAEGLRLAAAGGIGRLGAGADALDIDVGTVSARAGKGGINLLEASDIVVGDVNVAVNVVNADGSAGVVAMARQADLRTLDNGSIVLDAANSFIILNEGSGAADGAVAADGSGNVLLHAGVSIIANADVASGSGHVTLAGATLIEFKANADIRTGGGSIDVEASGGAIVQHASSLFASGSGNVRLVAQTNVTVGDIVTGGDVSVSAVTGFIRDADALVGGANDSDNDITAHALRLTAGGAIGVVDLTGSTGNAIETAVGTLSVRAGGAVGIASSGALGIGSVGGSVGKVGLDGVAVALADPVQGGVAAGGAIAMAVDGDLNIDADVRAASVNLAAGAALNVAGGVTVAATSGAATLDARGGVLNMAGSAIAGAATNLRLHAAGDVMVGNLGAVNVSVVADGGAIVNAAGSGKNVTATTLRLQADDAIGSAARHLTTAVGTISASSRGTDSTGIYITEDDALLIGSSGFGVDAVQTGLRAGGGNAAIVLDTGAAVGMAGSVSAAATGVLAIHAASGAITVGNLSAAVVSLSADAGAIANAAGSSKNISADSAILRAGAAIGTGSRALTTSLGSLEASASALYVAEDDAIRLAGVGTSAGNLVVTTIDGAISVDGSVAASRNLLLAAGNADLVVNADVASATGSISLRAGRDALVNGAVQTRAVAQTIDLLAGRNLAMSQDGILRTLDGAVLLTAGGDVAVGTIDAGSANVGIDAGGSVLDPDAAGDTGSDIIAGALRIRAGGAIGSAANALETAIGTIAASAGAGLFVAEADALAIGSVDVAVGRIDSAGVKTSVGAGTASGMLAGGDLAVTAAGAVNQGATIAAAGSAQLRGAAISMADGTASTAAAIAYAATGDVVVGLLDAGNGAVSISAGGGIADAQAAAAVQTVNLRAGSVSLNAGRGIGAAANAIETAAVTLAASSAAGDIVVREADSLTIGAPGLSAAAGNVVITLDSGTLDMAQAFSSAAGKDLTLAADHILFSQAVRGNGGKLLLSAANPLADMQAGTAGVIDQASLSHLAGGYAQVVLGAGMAGSGQDVRIDGSTAPASFGNPLLLDVSGSGSAITLAGALAAQGLDARGALLVDGSVTVAGGNGAAVAGGDMLFEQSIDGTAPGAILALAAGGDNVVIQGAIGAVQALAGFSIDNAANVSFARDVSVAGPVLINATGVVRFDGALTLDNGSITIRGASEVIIGDVVFHGQAGVVVIEADTLTLNGDLQGAGSVTLHPADTGREIVVGGSGVNGAYNVSAAQLAHLATATQVIIGTRGADGHAAAGAGPVTVNAIDFSVLTGAPVQVYGSVVTLAAGSGSLQAANGLALDGRDGVVLHDSIGSRLGDIKVYSALGGVSMDAGVSIAGSAGVILQGAGNLALGLVQGREVVLRSGGTILDAAADDKVNVTADSVSIIGYGPKLGSGNAVEVQAPAIYVSAPTGMVLQDTGADGRTHFYLLDGATMYEQAIAIGTVTRSTAAPAAVSGMQTAQAAPVTLAAAPAAAFAAFAEHTSIAAGYLATLNLADSAGAGTSPVLAASANGLQAAALDAMGDSFDFWLEDLML